MTQLFGITKIENERIEQLTVILLLTELLINFGN